MEALFNPAGLAALITALCTGVAGTFLTFKQFNANKAKTAHDIEASLRTELRADIEKYRAETEELRNKVTTLFEENLSLKHTLANVTQQNVILNQRLDKLLGNNQRKKAKVADLPAEPKRNKKAKKNDGNNGNSDASS